MSDNEYIDGLLSLSVHIFKEVYISRCDQISCKVDKVGERLHNVFRTQVPKVLGAREI